MAAPGQPAAGDADTAQSGKQAKKTCQLSVFEERKICVQALNQVTASSLVPGDDPMLFNALLAEVFPGSNTGGKQQDEQHFEALNTTCALPAVLGPLKRVTYPFCMAFVRETCREILVKQRCLSCFYGRCKGTL